MKYIVKDYSDRILLARLCIFNQKLSMSYVEFVLQQYAGLILN